MNKGKIAVSAEAYLAHAASLKAAGSDKDQLARVNRWLEVHGSPITTL